MSSCRVIVTIGNWFWKSTIWPVALVDNISFTVHAGEVLGFYGSIGSGRTETMRAIFGADRAVAGEVRLKGRTVRNTASRHGRA